jgi:hypothetical protein
MNHTYYHFKTEYYQGEARLSLTTYYPSGNLAVALIDTDGSRVMTVSVNLPQYEELLSDACHFFLKDWSENSGIKEELLRHGLIEDTGVTVISGYVEASMVKLIKEI